MKRQPLYIIGFCNHQFYIIEINNFKKITHLTPYQINNIFSKYEGQDYDHISLCEFLKHAEIPKTRIDNYPDFLSMYYFICLYFAYTQYNLLTLMDNRYINESIIKINIKHFARAIKYIPGKFRSDEIYEYAIYHTPSTSLYYLIPNKYISLKLCKILYYADHKSMKLFPLHIRNLIKFHINRDLIKDYDMLDNLVFGTSHS